MFYTIQKKIYGVFTTRNALLYESLQTPPTKYTMPCLDWKKVSSPQMILFIAWDGENYPFEAWNSDQTLQSAMPASVNWYFQSIDEQLGADTLLNYIKEIKYGNENMSGAFSTYWLESSLKISPIEQVELLTKLYNNHFNFSPENIHVLKRLHPPFLFRYRDNLRKDRNRSCRWTKCKWMVYWLC